MQPIVHDLEYGARRLTRALMSRMVSPICGISRYVGAFLRGSYEPRMIIAGGDLTGVHLLLDRPAPNRSYHIGGGGFFPDEPLIRTLAEALERYAQLIGAIHHAGSIRYATHNELTAAGEEVVPADKLSFFSSAQYARKGFPFHPFSQDATVGWLRTRSLITEREVWAPAQLLLVGYKLRHDLGEPWLSPGVTTGTAAHTDPVAALRNAILELMQLDSVMGHWYSETSAPTIVLDKRTMPVERVMRKYLDRRGPQVSFHWLRNADLPVMTVACVFRKEEGVPAAVVGLGADTSLTSAIYKALLEAIGVFHLAKIVMVQEQYADAGIDPATVYDLDRNVAFYALRENSGMIDRRFGGEEVLASDLAADSATRGAAEIRRLVDAFRSTGKELLHIDLTTSDIRELGFSVPRVWSPDTLPLSLPSVPQMVHHRFTAYGGVAHADMHPYP